MKRVVDRVSAIRFAGLVLLAFLVLLPGISHAQLFYQVIDLGTLGGQRSGASRIDAQSRVVGWAETAAGERHAFLYDTGSGVMRDLGLLPGGSSSLATVVANDGRVAGYGGINVYGPQFQEFRQAFLWDNGSMTPLGALYCPCTFNRRYGTSEAHGMNAQGQVVGHSETARGSHVRHAFLWENGSLRDIGGGPGSWTISRAFAINGATQVVGDFAVDAGLLGTDTGFDRRAFLWQNEVVRNLGTLPGHTSSTALAINEGGDIAGWSGATDGARSMAFLWRNGAMRPLGMLLGDVNSRALGMDDAGQVVGWSASADQSTFRAFLWNSSGMHDLNATVVPPSSFGWKLLEASDINGEGLIVGTGIKNGLPRAYLLRPVAIVGGVRGSSLLLLETAGGKVPGMEDLR